MGGRKVQSHSMRIFPSLVCISLTCHKMSEATYICTYAFEHYISLYVYTGCKLLVQVCVF